MLLRELVFLRTLFRQVTSRQTTRLVKTTPQTTPVTTTTSEEVAAAYVADDDRSSFVDLEPVTAFESVTPAEVPTFYDCR